MADVVTVALGEMGSRARAKVAEGQYDTISDVVCEGLRALDREEIAFEASLKAKVAEALADNRPGVPLETAFARIEAALPLGA